jgi:hypothetical protein
MSDGYRIQYGFSMKSLFTASQVKSARVSRIQVPAAVAKRFARLTMPATWDESARWWTLMVSLANFVSIYLLVRLYNAEGKRFLDIFKFSRAIPIMPRNSSMSASHNSNASFDCVGRRSR